MQNFNIKMPKNAEYIIDELYKSNYSAYIVGGCVRDSIMGVKPHDWDICTSATPDEIMKIFSDCRIVETGIKHGTVTIIIDGEPYEVTTFRIDGEYEDNRHPKDVIFTDDLKKDLERRDFTVNAMAYNYKEGLIDPFNGIQDIYDMMIRCVGNPDDRFKEDALRLLRAVRFSIKLKYRIDFRTLKSIRNNKMLLKNIAIERTTSEIFKTLSYGKYNEIFLELLQVIIPEMTDEYIDELLNIRLSYDSSLYKYLCLILPYWTTTCNLKVLKTYEGVRNETMKFLRFDNNTIKKINNISNTVLYILNNRKDFINNSTYLLNYALSKTDNMVMDVIDLLQIALSETDDFRFKLTIADAKFFYSEEDYVTYKISNLKIDGNYLKNIGLEGKEIGKCLEDILDKVLRGKVKNQTESIINYIKIFYMNNDEVGEIV